MSNDPKRVCDEAKDERKHRDDDFNNKRTSKLWYVFQSDSTNLTVGLEKRTSLNFIKREYVGIGTD